MRYLATLLIYVFTMRSSPHQVISLGIRYIPDIIGLLNCPSCLRMAAITLSSCLLKIGLEYEREPFMKSSGKFQIELVACRSIDYECK